jgi:ABC-2 type transport system ATP-binding protein
MEAIVIEHLSKKCEKFLAVDDLNLTVESGACVAYLGPNGAGKTTTIKILTHFLRATSGRAYLHGKDVIRDPKGALEGVGAVVETPELYPRLTPRECYARYESCFSLSCPLLPCHYSLLFKAYKAVMLVTS